MPKKTGIVFIVMGAVLILSSLLLLLYTANEDEQAGTRSQQALEQMHSEIERVTPTPEAPQPTVTPVPTEMTVVNIDGNDYIGYVAVPALELELPVMSDWSYAKLRVAPCRHAGATFTDDLVIAAHNYDKHFGKLKELTAGDRVTFTDMDGRVTEYVVAVVETVKPTAVSYVLDSAYDLVLYTCTYGGKTRVAAFCSRIEA